MIKIFIPHQFTTLNQHIAANNSNRYKAAKIKRDETYQAKVHFIGKKIETPCTIKFIWHVKNMRTDPDNIAFAKKYILDGMVTAGALPDDTMKHIKGFTDEFIVDKDNVGVEIILDKVA